MSTTTMLSLATTMIAERHGEAARVARSTRLTRSNPTLDRTVARLTGPLAAVAALAMLLVSIPALSAAPANTSSAPMPTPTPGAGPTVGR